MKTRRVTIHIGGRTIRAVLAEGDLWLTQRSMAEIFETSPQNVTIHITNVGRYMDVTNGSRYFAVAQKEGRRTIARRLRHYSLEIVHAVAIRAQRYDEANVLMGTAGQYGVLRSSYRIVPMRERDFAEILTSTLKGITSVIPQYHVLGYFIDFYLPEHALAVEYDESHHAKPSQNKLDKRRQADIAKAIGVRFLRVREGRELQGINRIVRHIIEHNKLVARKTVAPDRVKHAPWVRSKNPLS